MENLLALGAQLEFEGSPSGTVLMTACQSGRLESVILLVRWGAALFYHGPNGFRTAFDETKTSKPILQWLLVTRFSDQGKIGDASYDVSSSEPVQVQPWSGITKAELVICGELERRSDQSSKEYWIYLMRQKREWRGNVIPITDKRKTIRPSKLRPVESVHIHSDGYEASGKTEEE
ncbi:hypothetical protein M426DRAFT_13064 [Hypoxylon sp. CI-4A]|nr:hypothetical protein M426DRAFT_13064 [Hypoxylon sp. CI-4A]